MSDTRLVTNTGLYRATHLIGRRVENLMGEPLGRLADVVIDLGESHIAAAILSLPGAPGTGEVLVAVPLSAVGFDPVDEKCLLNIDWEPLDRVWAADLSSRYGCAPYWH